MRYEEVTSVEENVLREVKVEYFPELSGAKIKLLFDTKKKTTGGKLVFARIQKPNELTRFFTTNETDDDEGYDYIIFLDKMLWDNIEDSDKKRLLRHEMRHTLVDLDSNNPWKLQGHTVEDFYEEIALNVDDPRWSERLGYLLTDLYEEEKELNR